MSIQTATTAQLDNAQRTIIAQTLYTMEHSMPTANLLEQFTLAQGESTMTVPKVGQMTAAHLTDGEDITEESDINMTTFDVTAVEAGMKVILTDKLARQGSESVFNIVGKQIGAAMARLKERDAIALFAGLNGGSYLGVDGKKFTLDNVAIVINYAKANKFGDDLVIVHHPAAIFEVVNTNLTAASPRWTNPSLEFAQNLLESFYAFNLNRVPLFEAGEIQEATSGSDNGIGAIFDRGALGMLTSKGLTVAQQRDESLRATELIPVADYKAFEVDDSKGIGIMMEIGTQAIV